MHVALGNVVEAENRTAAQTNLGVPVEMPRNITDKLYE